MIRSCFLVMWMAAALSSCSRDPSQQNTNLAIDTRSSGGIGEKDLIVYNSEKLTIKKIAEHTYVHISYLDTESFGKVDCNGMIVVSDGEALVFDTPNTDEDADELIAVLQDSLALDIIGVVATHFHQDCLGGLDAFHAHQIASTAHLKTIDLAKTNGSAVPQNGFEKQVVLSVGKDEVILTHFGEGHTKDNVVAYYSGDKVLFGGCLVKAEGAGKGNLEDANVNEWSATISQIKNAYPSVQLVIPGHGEWGGSNLLDYTEAMFRPEETP